MYVLLSCGHGVCVGILKVMRYCECEHYLFSALGQSSYCDMTTFK